MPNGAKPDFRIIVKPEGKDNWDDIGALWKKESGKFSGTITGAAGEKINFLVVPNVPKAKGAKPEAAAPK